MDDLASTQLVSKRAGKLCTLRHINWHDNTTLTYAYNIEAFALTSRSNKPAMVLKWQKTSS